LIRYAKRFGVYDGLPPMMSMSLGAGETTVLRMIAGYSMFANGGKRVKATLIDRHRRLAHPGALHFADATCEAQRQKQAS